MPKPTDGMTKREHAAFRAQLKRDVARLRGKLFNARNMEELPLLEDLGTLDLRGFSWVIVGGESGVRKSRPCNVAWIRSIVKQCKAAGVPCFVKQLGRHIEIANDSHSEWPREGDDLLDPYDHQPRYQGELCIVRTNDGKGGNPDEWPADLRVRQFPEVAR